LRLKRKCLIINSQTTIIFLCRKDSPFQVFFGILRDFLEAL